LAQNGGETEVKGVKIKAIEAMEALNHYEHDPDQNGMYRFEVDGVSIGHIGDVGNAFSAAQIEFFEGVDIFLALAGGHPTMELDDLKTAIDAIQPKWTVPMHFRTLSYTPRNTFWITNFLSYFDESEVDFAFDYEKDIMPETLPTSPRVLVMDYVRR
jgi:L-ascorbate metabolism protein UlaG (beta-lactamase superfamily)